MNRKEHRNNASAIFMSMVAFSCFSPVFADEGPSPGPAMDARQRLFERIQQAKGQGMGISSYMAAFNDIEARVKAGDPEDKVSARVAQIHKAVSDQIERAKVLKNQKPLPPMGSQVTGGDLPDHGGPAGNKGGGPPAPAAGGLGGGALADKLKKLDSLPEPIKERLLNDPSIIEKLKQRAGGGGGGEPPQGPPAGGAGPGGAGGGAGQPPPPKGGD